MKNKKFDPDKIIDYAEDYYGVLGLEKGCLPEGKTQYDREITARILEGAYRTGARRAHPDFPGGSNAQFKLLVRAHTILSDPLLKHIYESGGIRPAMAEDPNSVAFGVDWDKLGTYRQGTLADTTGFTLYLALCERAKELGIVPAFYPTDMTHSYEWDLAIPDTGQKIALSIVHDESDVMGLTDGEDLEFSLPFKIYICFPRSVLNYLREPDERIIEKSGKSWRRNGRLHAAMYSDHELLETTKLQDAYDYIAEGGKVEAALLGLRDGSLLAAKFEEDKQQKRSKWVPKEDMNENDRQTLRNILRGKSYEASWNPHAAEFLKDLPDSPVRGL